jgi:RNA polymerase sigma-32 factor
VGTTQAQRRLFFGLGKERARIERGGGVVEVKQLAAALNVKEKEVIEMERRLAAHDTSLDAPVGRQEDGGTQTYGDFVRADARLRPDYQSEAEEFGGLLKSRLADFAKTLSGRDAAIFRRRLLSEEAATLSEIAAKFGLSRERIRQLEMELKRRLRRYLEATFGDGAQMIASFTN